MEEMLEKEAAPAEKTKKKRSKKNKPAPAEKVQPAPAAPAEDPAQQGEAAPAAAPAEKPRRLPHPVYHTVYHVEQALYADRDAERPILRRVDEGNLRFDLLRCAAVGAAVLGVAAVCAVLLGRRGEDEE